MGGRTWSHIAMPRGMPRWLLHKGPAFEPISRKLGTVLTPLPYAIFATICAAFKLKYLGTTDLVQITKKCTQKQLKTFEMADS